MAEQRPLVILDGQVQQLPIGDTIAGVPVGDTATTGTGGVIDGGLRTDTGAIIDGGERV